MSDENNKAMERRIRSLSVLPPLARLCFSEGGKFKLMHVVNGEAVMVAPAHVEDCGNFVLTAPEV